MFARLFVSLFVGRPRASAARVGDVGDPRLVGAPVAATTPAAAEERRAVGRGAAPLRLIIIIIIIIIITIIIIIDVDRRGGEVLIDVAAGRRVPPPGTLRRGSWLSEVGVRSGGRTRRSGARVWELG